MHSRIRDRLTYANVVSTLALVVAVAGGSTAIAVSAKGKAPKGSVVARSIKPGNVAAKQLSGLIARRARTPLNDTQAGDGIYASGSAIAICPERTRALTGTSASGGQLGITGLWGGNAWISSGRSDSGPGGEVSAVVYCLPEAPRKPYGLPAEG